MMDKAIDCQSHNKRYENICNDCNVLLCKICAIQHTRKKRDHSCYHIDEIKEGLNNLDININNDIHNTSNNNYNTENYFQEELIKIWNSIKSSSSYLNTLELKENEISDHFKQFHEYLIIEEHKLKSKIINVIESIKQQTNQQINQLKSIINILNLNNNNNNNQITDEKLKYDEDEEEPIDKTSQYSIETIIKTIQESSTLNQFLKRNNKSIFNQQYQNNEELLNNLNNDINLSILESIHNHKKLYCNILSNQPNEYTITIDNQSIDNAKQSINQSIELTINTKDPYLQTKPTITRKRSTTGIILSTNIEGKIATLFDTNNDNKVIGEIDFIHNISTYNSIVNVGEYIYIFGGYNENIENKGNDKYIRYSIAEKKIDHRGIIDTIDIGCYISTCFDGNEYIYLIGGYNTLDKTKVHRIDRFNIKTMKFEKYFQYNNTYYQTHSFFYNGVIYFIQPKKIYKFDPITKGLTFEENNDLFLHPRSACSDGNGNIYILSRNNEFIRYNIESMKVDKLGNILLSENRLQSMVYVHGCDDKSSRIYVFGGVKLKNYMYTIENNQWSTFYSEDPYNRTYCASVLI